MNTHTETEEKNNETKENFYEKVEETYSTLPSNDIKIVIGDLNGKIEREELYRDVIGRDSLHRQSNDNELRVIKFVTSRNMVISSTHFTRRDSHKRIWTPSEAEHIIKLTMY